MSAERNDSQNTQKITEISPIIGDSYILENEHLSLDIRLRLSQIPRICREENAFVRLDRESVLCEVFPVPFFYTRYVDKEGELHYWEIELEPQLVGSSQNIIEGLVIDEPTPEKQNRLARAFRDNFPRLKITPNKGVVMDFVDGITLNITDEGCFKTDRNGERYLIPPRDGEVREGNHYKMEEMKINIEEFVFDDSRRDDSHLYTHGIIRYVSHGVEEIVRKLHEQLQSGLITESMVRGLVNPILHVSYESISGDNEEIAA